MTRNKQTVYPGLRKNYLSLERPGRRAKQQLLVSQPGQEFKRNQILTRLCELDEQKSKPFPAVSERVEDVVDAAAIEGEEEPAEYHHQLPKDAPKRRKPRDTKADTETRYDAWKEIVQSLVQPLRWASRLLYSDRSHSRSCHLYVSNARISTDSQTIDLPTCGCRPFATILVEHGFFPTAPSQPNLAISVDFFGFYYALFEQSADAVGAMASALSKFYNRQGFAVTDAKVSLH